MKFNLLRLRGGNQSGIILLVVLWMMVILSLLAVGLGRRTSIDLSLAKYSIGKLKANYLAWAGVMRAAQEIKKDTEDPETGWFDTLYQCGVKIDGGKTPEDMFRHIEEGGGYFDIGYPMQSAGNVGGQTYFGMQAEEGRINLNGITLQDFSVLSSLLVLLGYNEDTAVTVAASVADWHDADMAVTNAPFGAEEAYYKELNSPYPCKNARFESVEELLLVRGMTPEMFSKIKNYVTVFPMDAVSVSVNVHMAPAIVIQALARSMAGPITNTAVEDADSLTEKMVNYRKGNDGIEFTADDRLVDMTAMNLNQKEQVIFLTTKGRMTDVSNYLRVRVRGVDAASRVHSDVEAVINRGDLSIVYWHRN